MSGATLPTAPSSGPAAVPARPVVAVAIPCWRVGDAVFRVIERIGPEVDRIYVVDDACPEHTGDRVEAQCRDPRVVVLRNAVNQGVGGAVLHAYRQALADACTLVVKIDGDGQMDPALLPRFVRPLLQGNADYTKGNRFHDLRFLQGMPALRLAGNAALSFMTKASSGYWQIFDPTNGYTAIRCEVLRILPLDRIARDYFFESDMLFRLNTVRAVVKDVPMAAVYGDERSGLNILRVIPRFLGRHGVNFVKRVFYSYVLRDFNVVSVSLLCGLPSLLFGLVWGISAWIESEETGRVATAGTVMLATLPFALGVLLTLMAVTLDVQNQPKTPLHPDLE